MKKKRLLAWLLTLAMVVTMPAAVFAADIETDDPEAVAFSLDTAPEQAIVEEVQEEVPVVEETLFDGADAVVTKEIIVTNNVKMFLPEDKAVLQIEGEPDSADYRCAVVEQLAYIQSIPFCANRGMSDCVSSSTVSLNASEGV